MSEGTDEDGGREAQLAKIQAMLDTTKVCVCVCACVCV